MSDPAAVASVARPRSPASTPAAVPSARGRRPSRPLPAATEWPLILSLLLLLTVACGALGPLLRGSWWWWLMALTAALVLVSAALFRRVGLARALVPIASLTVLVGALTLFFGGGTGLLWLIPTPESVGVLDGLVRSGADSIAQQSVPAEVTGGILFLLAAGAGLIAAVMYVVAVTFRAPALAGALVLVPLLVPGVIQSGPANVIILTLTAIAYLVVLRVDVRRRRSLDAVASAAGSTARVFVSSLRRQSSPLWGTVSVGAVAIVLSLVIGLTTPGLTGTAEGRQGSNALLFGSGVSPMINLGQDLRRREPGPVLHYTSTAEQRSYFTLLTLDSFVGSTWTARIDGAEKTNLVGSIDRPPGLADDVATTDAQTSVVIDGVNTRWLPVPARTVGVEGLRGSWHWDTRTRAIASDDISTLGQEYTATSLDVQPTAEQLRASGREYPRGLSPNLELPTQMPDIIASTAAEVTAGAASDYDAAVALQGYLNSSAFAYDTESPVEQGYDGGGVDVVGVFLDTKRGYCVHFASAMATMARALGIPSRISLGYLPGVKSQDLEQGLGQYLVDSHDLHAWPELYFVGVGWVPFEPTPGRGTVPNYEAPTAVETPTELPGQAAGTTAPRTGPDPLAGDVPLPGDASSATAESASVLGRAGLVSLALVLLMLVPAAARAMQRVGRRRRIRSGALTRREASQAAWTEVADVAVDHHLDTADTETPREFAARLTPLLGNGSTAATVLEALLVEVERARFARRGAEDPPEPGPSAETGERLGEVTAAIRAGSTRRDRLWALLWPKSLIRGVWLRLNGRSPRNA
ncbi:hypothetical protein GY21_03090 [Cryobacterium roopkundense]|uniref:Transglutaminase-like putative cysteine protease/DNA-binding phage protein n=1 Tax=Cryobacterium roopkundense TaxID=1001240 RepID=A0A099JP29_9MICO|nr:DUF3488 and transglutaminase-like domain-containing protein [Cryobacterium roopkundense]KGJ80104.1 hypothetical protein GY21_03090 [Cryobacterium roopkundense]MBB5641637.1 transglutaminase-like putative cysteine protease/DNA-binding phage protein [Cryobacterium roopkundense]